MTPVREDSREVVSVVIVGIGGKGKRQRSEFCQRDKESFSRHPHTSVPIS